MATLADRKRAIPKPIKSKMRSERCTGNFPHLMKKTTYQTVYGFKPINKHMPKIKKIVKYLKIDFYSKPSIFRVVPNCTRNHHIEVGIDWIINS